MWQRANSRVATDGNGYLYWQDSTKRVRIGATMATDDLSGCTVIVVSSPFVSIMIHVWERRGPGLEFITNPTGPGQRQADNDFFANARAQLQTELSNLFGSPSSPRAGIPNAANNWNGWLPKGYTTVSIVAPVWNPDYIGTPWANGVDPQLSGTPVYPAQVQGLKRLVEEYLPQSGPESNDGKVYQLGYRRRYHNDPDHKKDDRDVVVVNSVREGGKVYAVIYYDDIYSGTIAQLI
jgi:hypothetical protein